MSKQEQERGLDWGSNAVNCPSVRIEHISHFDARGKHSMYGRGDHLGRVFYMDIWRAKDGRLLARFWSRNQEVDWESYEIIGLPAPKLPDDAYAVESGEYWAPECLRKAYDDWVISEM